MDLARLQPLDELSGAAQAADHGAAHRGAGQLKGGLPQSGPGTDRREGVRVRVFPCEHIGRCPQGRLHHAAGGPEDNSGPGVDAQGAVRLLFRQEGGFQLVGPEHTDQLPGRENQVHIRAAVHRHGRQLTLRLFGHTGHDGHAEDFFRRYPQRLSKPALSHAAKHLLGRLGGGKLMGQLRVLALQEPDPAGAAACEHGPAGQPPGLEAVEELAALLHNGQVGGKVGVKHILEAQPPQGGGHAAHGGLLPLQPKCLAPGGTDGGSHLDHGNLVRVGQGGKGPLGVVPLPQAAHGTVGDALAAQGTVRVLNDPVVRHVDGGAAAGARQVPDGQGLDLVTNLDAAHAFDALIIIMVQGEGGGPGPPQSPWQLALIGQGQDAQVIGNRLKLAVPAADAGGALAVVLGQNELHIGPPGGPGTGGIGVDHHSLLHRVVAGGDHGPLPLHLHAADPAGSDLIDPLQVAQVGNTDVGRFGGLQDGGALRHLDSQSVNGHRHHSVFLPPLKIP